VRKSCSQIFPLASTPVSVFHDENMNQKPDKNFVGVPKEGYGASNNPKKKIGPPSFDETKFQLSGTEQSLEIKLMYSLLSREFAQQLLNSVSVDVLFQHPQAIALTTRQ